MVQLFYNDRELKPTPHAVNGLVYDEMTLDELYIGPGETLYGYDLAVAPDYWPKEYNKAKETLQLMPEFKQPGASPDVAPLARADETACSRAHVPSKLLTPPVLLRAVQRRSL